MKRARFPAALPGWFGSSTEIMLELMRVILQCRLRENTYVGVGEEGGGEGGAPEGERIKNSVTVKIIIDNIFLADFQRLFRCARVAQTRGL